MAGSQPELLELRQKLMASNKREVQALLKEAQNTIDSLRAEKDSEVRSLTALLEATRGQLHAATSRLRATEQVLAETERATEVRIHSLHRELDITRGEFAELGESMKSLSAAHRRAHATLEDETTRKQEIKRRERELELEQIRLTDLSSTQQKKIGDLTEQLQRAQEKTASITQSWLQGQREQSSLQQRLSVAESTRAVGSSRQVERLSEAIQLLEVNNKRLLRIIAQVGLSSGERPAAVDDRQMRRDVDELRSIQSLFRLVVSAGKEKFQFLGDSLLYQAEIEGVLGSKSVKPFADPTVLHDLRTAVSEHNAIVDVRRELTSSLRPHDHHQLQDESGFDPVVRLRTERDFWIPMPIVTCVSEFRMKYFSNQPADVFYALLVELSRLFRECAAISPTDSVTRRSAFSSADGVDQAMPTGVVRTHAALNVKDIASDLFAVDAVRCVAGLRSLMSQTEKLCGAGGMFQSLPAHAVREMLSSSLRTVENLVARCRRLEHEHGVHESIRRGDAQQQHRDLASSAGGHWPCGAAVCVERVETLIEERLRKALVLCAEGIGEATSAGSTARGYLRAPQDPHDPDAPPNSKCPVLTPFFVRGLNDLIRRHESREVQVFRRIHDLLLSLRKDACDERTRVLTGSLCSALHPKPVSVGKES